MIDLYEKEKSEQTKKNLKKYVIFSIVILGLTLIGFITLLATTTRENVYFNSIFNGITTSGLLCFIFTYICFKLIPTKRDINFVKSFSKEKETIIKIESFSITDRTVVKQRRSFFVCNINGFEYLLQKDKTTLVPSNLKSVIINGRFIVGVKEKPNE